MAKAARKYLKVALLGAIAACFMSTLLTGFVLDIILTGVAFGLILLFFKL